MKSCRSRISQTRSSYLGAGPGNYLSYGAFPQGGIKDTARYFLLQGIILNNDISKVYPIDPGKVAEYVTHSWYEYAEADQVAKLPSEEGETNPKYAGPKPPRVKEDALHK